jgi:hypothetical protein
MNAKRPLFSGEYFADPGKRPIQFCQCSEDGINFTTDFNIRFVSGHTEAMMLPLINYKGKQILYMADLLPSVGHLPIPM